MNMYTTAQRQKKSSAGSASPVRRNTAMTPSNARTSRWRLGTSTS